ncbi:MAG: hypothetical protein L6Q68_07065 [Aquabacterium sp.]|nr:hypothetical protein [Aquabacterium sp.]
MKLHRTLSNLPIVLALAAVGQAHAAKGELLEIAWSPDGSFARETQVGPGRFLEVCGKLPAGMAIQWQFDARRSMDFNIHFHEGKDVRYPARQSAVAKATDTFTTPVEQDYCWMWTNKSKAEAAISFSLRKK